MILEYSVKYNGVIYKAGEDVPNGAFSAPAVNEPEVTVEVAKEEEKPKTTVKSSKAKTSK